MKKQRWQQRRREYLAETGKLPDDLKPRASLEQRFFAENIRVLKPRASLEQRFFAENIRVEKGGGRESAEQFGRAPATKQYRRARSTLPRPTPSNFSGTGPNS